MMTLKNIPSTNPHKLSAERVARVTKALVKRLVEKGVLAPPSGERVRLPHFQLPLDLEPPGLLDCRPHIPYRVFHLIKGGKVDR
jgi:hypothetical protein